MKFAIFVKRSLPFNSFYCLLFINKTLQLIRLKTRIAMNAKNSVFVICVETIIYLLLHNLHDCTFNGTRSCAKFKGSIPSSCRIMAIYVFFRLSQFLQFFFSFFLFVCLSDSWSIFKRLLFDI